MSQEIFPQREFAVGKPVTVNLNEPLTQQFGYLAKSFVEGLGEYKLPDKIVCLPLPDETHTSQVLFFRSSQLSERQIVELPSTRQHIEYSYFNFDDNPSSAQENMLDINTPLGIVYDNMLSENFHTFSEAAVHIYLSMAKNWLVNEGIFALQLTDNFQANNVEALKKVSHVFGTPELCRQYKVAGETNTSGAVWIFRKKDGVSPFSALDIAAKKAIHDTTLRRLVS